MKIEVDIDLFSRNSTTAFGYFNGILETEYLPLLDDKVFPFDIKQISVNTPNKQAIHDTFSKPLTVQERWINLGSKADSPIARYIFSALYTTDESYKDIVDYIERNYSLDFWEN